MQNFTVCTCKISLSSSEILSTTKNRNIFNHNNPFSISNFCGKYITYILQLIHLSFCNQLEYQIERQTFSYNAHTLPFLSDIHTYVHSVCAYYISYDIE